MTVLTNCASGFVKGLAVFCEVEAMVTFDLLRANDLTVAASPPSTRRLNFRRLDDICHALILQSVSFLEVLHVSGEQDDPY